MVLLFFLYIHIKVARDHVPCSQGKSLTPCPYYRASDISRGHGAAKFTKTRKMPHIYLKFISAIGAIYLP